MSVYVPYPGIELRILLYGQTTEKLFCVDADQSICWQARLRDWRAKLLPQVNASLESGVLVSKGWVSIYGEFEIRAHAKFGKWKKVRRFQGFVAICSFTPKARGSLVQECQSSHIPGLATDLHTLTQTNFNHENSYFWIKKWGLW